MVPTLVPIGIAPWKALPPGVHAATLGEIEVSFATNPHRRKLFLGLVAALESLAKAGCSTAFLDGSYVTAKPNPADYDGCWDPTGVDVAKLDPVLLSFENKREKQKSKYLGELFPSGADCGSGQPFVDFFQTERFTGKRKGILKIDLSREPFTTWRY